MDVHRFVTRRVTLPNGCDLAFIREGSGRPVVLLHGYPMTKRLWWRNIADLAGAGFDVVAPDLRGYGESGLPADGHYDVATYSEDIRLLMETLVGATAFTVVGGDIGGAVALDLALRHPRLVSGICLFNAAAPELPPELIAGLDLPARPAADLEYFYRQGEDPDGLLKELDTPERRREYVAGFYTYRHWAGPRAFDAEQVAFMCEPFGDADRLRAAWVDYRIQCGLLEPSSPQFSAGPVSQPALVLYGPQDAMGDPRFVRLCRAGFTNCLGPFEVPDAGHFLPWEQAGTFNRALVTFLRALPAG